MSNSKVFQMIEKEKERQEKNIELIASENFVSDDILKAMGSCLTNKYAEGYPDIRTSGNKGRYYGGCEYVNEIEEYCCDLWKKVFNTDYHVNVQPHSGSQANFAAYMAVLKPGDTILALSLSSGGHLTHSSPVSFVGKLFNVVTYELDEEGFIDYDDLKKQVIKHKPALILAGASAYSRTIDFERIKKYIDDARKIKTITDDPIKQKTLDNYDPLFMVDMAHIAGLIAGEEHPSPFGYADIITTTTHKTLRGPRGGLIFCKPELAKKIDSAVFPCSQGGPCEHIIAAKAICAEEALTEEYREYIRQVVKNSRAMSEEFKNMGYKVVTDGTDNHLFLLDFSPFSFSGKEVQDLLDIYFITVNKNSVPGEKRPPKETSGIRIGTAAMTTKGWKEEDFRKCARRIDEILRENLMKKKD